MSNFYFFLENDPKEGPLDDFSIFLLRKKKWEGSPHFGLLPSSAQSQAPAGLGIVLVSSNTPTHPPTTRTSSKKLEYQPSGALGPSLPPNQTSRA